MYAAFTTLLLCCLCNGRTAAAAATSSPVHQCCTGRTLKLGLFPTNFPPWFDFDNGTKSFTGFVPDVWKLVAEDMGAVPMFVETTTSPGSPPEEEAFQHADAFFVLVTGSAYSPGREGIAISADFYHGTFDTITLKVRRDRSAFALFEPFQSDLWTANLACFFCAGVLLIFFNAISPSDEFAGLPLMERLDPKTWLLSFYHMTAFLVSGEDYEWTTWPGRILRLGLLFLLLVTTASYTANLAAFFTQPSFQILGPADLEKLATSRACTTFAIDAHGLGPFTGSIIALEEPVPGSGLPFPTTTDRKQFCLQKLRDKDVDAYVVGSGDSLGVVKSDCDGLELRSNLNLGSVQIAWGLQARDPLTSNLSTATVHLKSLPEYGRLLKKYFQKGEVVCPVAASTIAQLTLESQRGLFYIFGAGAGLSALVAILQAVQARRRRWQGRLTETSESDDADKSLNRKAEHTMTEGELLRLLVKKVDAIGNQRTAGRGSAHASEENLAEEENIRRSQQASTPKAPVPIAIMDNVSEGDEETLRGKDTIS